MRPATRFRIGLFAGAACALAVASPAPVPLSGADDAKAKTNLDVPKDPLKGFRDGKFAKPATSFVPTSYFYALGPKGDPVGEGKTIAYRGDKLKVSDNKGVIEVVVGENEWKLELAGPKGAELKAGEYAGAKRYPFNDAAPGLTFGAAGRGCNKIAGRFTIWELETNKKGEVTRLAVDFVQQCEEKGAPLPGVVRFNSSFR